MVFSSTIFLFLFLPILLAVYYFCDTRYKNIVLLLASLFFYAWGEPKNVFIMLFSILVNYVIGILIEKGKGKKALVVFSVIYNLGILFVFKYLNFAAGVFNYISPLKVSIREIALPIGISFYTFQIMSYTIDVYRGNVKAQKKLTNLALYISLFPQLIAGPIVRYIDVEKQLNDRMCSFGLLHAGIVRFMIGFSKKVLIADQLSKLVDIAFGGTYPSIYVKWFGMIAYTLQIYFDFSGYSDMAIGLGKMFGFEFLENFDYPYIAKSIKEFWRRWHISLSSWFRDYLYIPLGGNRKGNVRTYINLIIVFLATGIWHGASFNFVFWGLYYAVFLVIERLGFSKVLDKFPKVLRHCYTCIIVMVGWVFFRADSLKDAVIYISDLVTLSGNDFNNFLFVVNVKYACLILIGIILVIPHPKIKNIIHKNDVTKQIGEIILVLIFIVAISCLIGSGFSPFLYFRF